MPETASLWVGGFFMSNLADRMIEGGLVFDQGVKVAS
jgi:hypothetical protein